MQLSLPSWLTNFVPNLPRRTRRAARARGAAPAPATSWRASSTFFDGLEPLENRALLSVALNAQGWTDITPSTDSRQIFVSSSSGNDANAGTQAAPLRTISAAYARTRSGSPDWILLKRGDVFNESMSWRRSGRSADEPTVLTAYGTGARPSVQPPAGQSANATYSDANISHVAFVGIDFYARSHDPSVAGFNPSAGAIGIQFTAPGTNFLMEDCSVRYFGTNVVLGGRGSGTQALNNVTLRRNVITDAYSNSAHSQGLLMGETNVITIVENLFDHNGWNESVSGAEKTIFNHNMYIHESNLSNNNIVSGNIVARASSHGVQLRRGGTISDNLAIDNAIGLQPGGGDSPIAGGVVGNVVNNVVLEGGDIGAAPRGFGIVLKGNVRDSAVSGNIISDDRSSAPYANGIIVESGVVRTALNSNVVWDWANPLDQQSGASITQSNNFWGPRNGPNTAGFADTTRNAARYNASLGGTASNAAFLAGARQQSRTSWNAAYTAQAANAWIRAGFATGGTIDATAPTATLAAAGVTTAGATSHTFTVTYADNVAVNVGSIDGSDVRVTGPNGFNAAASLVSVNNTANGTPRTATYRLAAPGGTWDAADNGTYSVALQAGQVSDTSGNAAAARTMGSFSVSAGAVVSGTLFSSVATFGDRSAYNTLEPSRWSVVTDGDSTALFLNSSAYEGLLGSRLGEMAFVNEKWLGDVSMTFRARSAENLGTNTLADFALVFGHVDANNYNYMLMNSSAANTQLFTVANGQRQLIATATRPGVTDNAYHDIKLVRSGASVSIAIDGVTLVAATDSRLAAAGHVGVGSFNDSAYFDDINAKAPVATTLDAGSAGVTATTGWRSFNRSGSVGGSLLSDRNLNKGGESVSYLPALAAGTYAIRLNSPGGSTLASNVSVDIYTAGGAMTTRTWNQTQAGYTTLGLFKLDANSRVVIRNAGTTSDVIADAVQFLA